MPECFESTQFLDPGATVIVNNVPHHVIARYPTQDACITGCGSGSGSGNASCCPDAPDTLYAHFSNVTVDCAAWFSGTITLQYSTLWNQWWGAVCVDDVDAVVGGYVVVSIYCNSSTDNNWVMRVYTPYCGGQTVDNLSLIGTHISLAQCSPFSLTATHIPGTLRQPGTWLTMADCSAGCSECAGFFDITVNEDSTGALPWIDPGINNIDNPITPCNACELPATLYYCRVGHPCVGCTGYVEVPESGELHWYHFPGTDQFIPLAQGHWRTDDGSLRVFE